MAEGSKNDCPENVVFASRVNQLDALELDCELSSLLKAQLIKIFQHLQPNLLIHLEPELIALLKLAVWKLTVLSNGATAGQELLDMKYGHASIPQHLITNKLWTLVALMICVSWAQKRILPALNSSSLSYASHVIQLTDWLEIVLKAAGIVNFLIFLRKGKFASLVERVLQIRSLHPAPQDIRQVQYEYTNRELLWHGFAEFLTFIVPLVNWHQMKNVLRRLVMPQMISTSPASRTRTDLLHCSVCGKFPVHPHDIGCRHVFCYYCISSNVLAYPRYQCPDCHHSADGLSSVCPTSHIRVAA